MPASRERADRSDQSLPGPTVEPREGRAHRDHRPCREDGQQRRERWKGEREQDFRERRDQRCQHGMASAIEASVANGLS